MGVDATLLAALRRRWDVEVVIPASAAESARVASTAAADGAHAVIAAGGDGTASAVARGLVGSDTALGVLPLGTANDLARALGLRHSPLDAARRLVAATARPMDLVALGGRPFCTVGGLGIVADSALAAGRIRASGGARSRAARGLGASIYRATALAELLTRRPLASCIELELVTPDGTTRSLALDSPGVFVANQRMCGGGLALPNVGPDDDGLFELLVIRAVSRVRLVDAFTRLALGLPIPDAVLHVQSARAARIRCARDESFLGDGDEIGRGREFEIRSVPRSLRVLGASQTG